MRRRPFSANGVRWSPPPGPPIAGVQSYADIARRRERAWLYCDHCVPPYTIADVDFAEPPWRRYHNYPTRERFHCPGCRQPLVMHLTNSPGTPFTDRFGETG